MCGLLGALGGDGLPGMEALRAALALLAHRGPDGEGLVTAPGLALGARRLAVQGDADLQRQPARSVDGRYALAFNGEVLGARREALASLVRAGGRPAAAGEGDTRLLLEALALLAARPEGLAGPDVLALLEGSMGALAFADLARGEVWLARDRLGVKPLHVVETPEATFFASEIRPLLALVPACRALDLDGLAELLHHHRPLRALPFRGVTALPPGACWRLRRGGRVTRWAGGTGIRDLEARGGADAPESLAPLGQALADAAREAAASATPPLLFLSGGLDSAAVAVHAGRSDLAALTGRFAPAGGAFDESGEAAEVAARAGLAHEVLDLHDRDLVADLQAVVAALEVPLAGPGALALWRLARRARERGVRVVLTGTGGDELLGGYARTALALGRKGRWTEGYEALAARVEAAGRDLAARQRLLLDRSGDLLPLLAPDTRERLPEVEPPGALARHGAPADEAAARLVEEEVEGTLPALLHVEDRVTMAHGLEGRPVPCLGDVPAAAAALPADWLVGSDGETKRALRAVLAGRVPERVRLDVRKRGFPTPFARAVRGAGRDLALAVLHDRRFRERGLFDPAACLRALDEPRAAHDWALYGVLSYELWARALLDAPVPVSEATT